MPLFPARRPERHTPQETKADDQRATAAVDEAGTNLAPLFGASRIAALSDGIFAIAITLLVFGLTVPEISQPRSPGETGGGAR